MQWLAFIAPMPWKLAPLSVLKQRGTFGSHMDDETVIKPRRGRGCCDKRKKGERNGLFLGPCAGRTRTGV